MDSGCFDVYLRDVDFCLFDFLTQVRLIVFCEFVFHDFKFIVLLIEEDLALRQPKPDLFTVGDDLVHLLVGIAQLALVLYQIFTFEGHILRDMLVLDLHFIAGFLVLLYLFLELVDFTLILLYIPDSLGLLLQPLLLLSDDLVFAPLKIAK